MFSMKNDPSCLKDPMFPMEKCLPMVWWCSQAAQTALVPLNLGGSSIPVAKKCVCVSNPKP